MIYNCALVWTFYIYINRSLYYMQLFMFYVSVKIKYKQFMNNRNNGGIHFSSSCLWFVQLNSMCLLYWNTLKYNLPCYLIVWCNLSLTFSVQTSVNWDKHLKEMLSRIEKQLEQDQCSQEKWSPRAFPLECIPNCGS